MLHRLLASKRGGAPSYPELEHFLHNYQPPAQPSLPTPVSKELYERLSKKDVERIVGRFEPEDKELWERLRVDTCAPFLKGDNRRDADGDEAS
jgi:hypothetical protein